MTRFGLLLDRYLTESGENQGDFADRCKIHESAVSRIRDGGNVTRRSFRLITTGFNAQLELQAELVAAHVFDYLPSEFHNLVEIRKRSGFSETERFQPPANEFEAAISYLWEIRDVVPAEFMGGIANLTAHIRRIIEQGPQRA
jgi:hypothetical protein